MKPSIPGVLGLALGICLSGSLAAAPGVAADAPAVERIGVDLIKVRDMIHSAKIKFKNGITGGITTNSRGLSGPPTPGKSCCSGNILAIQKLFKQIDAALAELDTCYNAANDLGGVDQLDLVRRDLDQLKKGVQLFQTVTNPQQTHQSLGGVQRAYLLLEESQRDLPGCEPAATKAQ